ncbi:ABC transporter substrate-binding protein [Planotetraspora sp. A-T 1434]|uniref:ABC transporter substrate-binding protein n=1 Tax=Planotetraspora sp. A-T 1434 TaxID=2979219 RepID=UPI0021C0A1EC|nr:ABC transporter substrate-binding protein [Planotetraspora sp. A-T 1434]MCT9929291.1 ABC transporter substrate-binding protein [Planotetraspora sp. A-T 1434]
MPNRLAASLAVAVLSLTACSSTRPAGGPPASSAAAMTASAQPASQFFDQAAYDKQLAWRKSTPTGDPSKPWLQTIEPQMADTAKFKKPGPWHVCFSNAGVGNPWRVTGLTTMKEEVKLHKEIGEFTVVDAEGKDDKQISDISDLLGKKCDALIISPNTTAALTPAVEKACQSGVPVVVFDRGVTTDCPVSFVHPIGGYAFGTDSAEFIASKIPKGGKVLALRILPGVDVLENRWEAARLAFQKAGANVVGAEFTDGDPAKVKTIVSDYLQRFGDLDGVWMDAGATTVAAIEAFQDAGKPVPPINGEDQQDFLALWQKDKLTAMAATYPVYQWRTAVIAATDILSGRQVPKEWVLPEPVITEQNLAQYVTPNMPPLFYPTCGCQDMPGFPQTWGGK